MGQYYKAYIESAEGVSVLYSWDYGSGLKLMEHSWLGNDFVNAAYTLIEDNPSKVAWVGDYSTDVGVDEEVYRICWGDGDNEVSIKPNDYFKNGAEGYLVNITKKQYIDLAEYEKLATDKDGWCINPLPLLTAIGNGLGGGDYRGGNQHMVGYWYMDRIGYDRSDTHGCRNITKDVVFKEGA